MALVEAQIRKAIDATTFVSPFDYCWFGQRSRTLPAKFRRAIPHSQIGKIIIYSLQSNLYDNLYCAGQAIRSTQHALSGSDDSPASSFVQRLSEANTSRRSWSPGWQVKDNNEQEYVVCKDALSLGVLQDDCRFSGNGPSSDGGTVSIRFPSEMRRASPGYYMVLSETPFDDSESGAIIRLYWNVTPEGAITFIRCATTLLNTRGVAFRLKTLDNPSRYVRCDAAVLYINASDFKIASPLLKEIHQELRAHLKRNVPVFTKELTTGVGLAENPLELESFGLHRCRLLAEALWDANEAKKKSLADRFIHVRKHFATHGVDLQKPYLNSGHEDCYDSPFSARVRVQRTATIVPDSSDVLGPKSCLRASEGIAREICRRSIWHNRQCSWMGSVPREPSSHLVPASISSVAIGPDLYDGTSGIALFLTEWYKAGGDRVARHTALAALRHALSLGADPHRNPLPGLYTGRLGIACAAARIGVLLEEAWPLEQAAVLARLDELEWRDYDFDLMSGRAGAIVALLILRDVLGLDHALDHAIRLGDELLESAEADEDRCSWRSAEYPNRQNLTGFSHGTAGVGYAFMELFDETGDDRYRNTAEQAFNYERYWFDQKAANWPDFREGPVNPRRTNLPPSGTTWCHGAPGVALSRLRAYELLTRDGYKQEADTALQTTAATTKNWLSSGVANYSLCHGVAGNADVLSYGARVLRNADYRQTAYDVAHAGIEKHAQASNHWPGGAGGGRNSGLMVGLAGIGYFYLRMQNCAIPSVLIFRSHSSPRVVVR